METKKIIKKINDDIFRIEIKGSVVNRALKITITVLQRKGKY